MSRNWRCTLRSLTRLHKNQLELLCDQSEKKKLTTGVWCDTPTNIVFQWKCLQHLNQFCFSTKHGSIAIFYLTDWQDFTSNDSNTIHRRLEKDHWSLSRKADKDKNPNFMRWMTDIKQPALQRHLAGVTPRSNVLRMCERVGQIVGPTLKCIWHIFFFAGLFERFFTVMKNGIYFIAIAFFVAELFKVLFHAI